MTNNNLWKENSNPSVSADLESVISSLCHLSHTQASNCMPRGNQNIGSYRRNSSNSNSDLGSEILVPQGATQSLSLNFNQQSAYHNDSAYPTYNGGVASGESPVLRRTTLSVGGYSLNGTSPSDILPGANKNTMNSNGNRLNGYAASVSMYQNNMQAGSAGMFNAANSASFAGDPQGASGAASSFFERFGNQLVEATKEVELGSALDSEMSTQQFVTSSSRSASLQVDAISALSDSRQNSSLLEDVGAFGGMGINTWNPKTTRGFQQQVQGNGPPGAPSFPFNTLYNPMGFSPHHQLPHSAVDQGMVPSSAGSETTEKGSNGSEKMEHQDAPTPLGSPDNFGQPPSGYRSASISQLSKDNADMPEYAANAGQHFNFDPRQYANQSVPSPQLNFGQFALPQDYPYGNAFFHGMGSPLPGPAPHPNSNSNFKQSKGNPYLKHSNKNGGGSYKNNKPLSSIPGLHENTSQIGAKGGNPKSFSASKNSGKRKKEPVYRSPKLEEFIKYSKEKNYQLDELYGHAYEFCKDQVGSRFIQDKLPTASEVDKEMVFSELRDHALELMNDVFGNYVIQMFFELGSDLQKDALTQSILGNVLKLTQSQYGCRIIQKSLVHIRMEQKIVVVDELKDHVYDCIKDQNGNHVIQKAIENIPLTRLPYILTSLKGQIYHFSTHPYGCRVVQRILEFGQESDRELVLNELKDFFSYLIQNEFGNYVIQYILKSSNTSTQDMLDVKQDIVDLVCQKIVEFSCHKYASNVVEQILFLGNDSQKNQLFRVIIPKTEDDACALNDTEFIAIMMKDQYANYVIQKLVKVTAGEDKRLLVISIKSYLKQVKSNSTANNNGGRKQKHLASVEKLAILVSNLSS